MAGRLTKYTPKTVEIILKALRDGNYRETSARLAGIGVSTFHDWLGQHPEFSEAVERAEADAEAAQVATIRKASFDTWTASAWWLERKFSERWGRKEKHEHTGANGGPIQHDHKLDFDFNAFTRIFDGGGPVAEVGAAESLDPAAADPETGVLPDAAGP